MARAQPRDDYYAILEVEQTATLELIVQSYKRLAFKLHPDRNKTETATAAFQLLGKASDTLRNPSKRLDYDNIYWTIKRPQGFGKAKEPYTPDAPNPTATPRDEARQIANIEMLKQDRKSRWAIREWSFNSTIAELQSIVEQLEQKVKDLDRIAAAEVATEASKNGWSAWVLSPLHTKSEDSEEEKSRKDRATWERKLERDLKERLLDASKEKLGREQSLLDSARQEMLTEDYVDDRNIQALKESMSARIDRERDEKAKAKAAEWRRQRRAQQQYRAQQAAEAFWKKNEEGFEKLAEATRKVQEELSRHSARTAGGGHASSRNPSQNMPDSHPPSACEHHGWWLKVQGRTECPSCGESWTFLLKCPGCEKQVCPKCQAGIRQARRTNLPA